MSTNKSNYPERPPRKGVPKSTHRGSKKSRTWLTNATAVGHTPALKPATLVGSTAGHDNDAYRRFRKLYGHIKVPQHEWGKKGRIVL